MKSAPSGCSTSRRASLHWQDLDDEEYELCPPLVLVGTDEVLGGAGLGQLTWLMNSGLPVKVLVLQSLDFGLGKPAADRVNLGLLALEQALLTPRADALSLLTPHLPGLGQLLRVPDIVDAPHMALIDLMTDYAIAHTEHLRALDGKDMIATDLLARVHIDHTVL